MWSWWLRGWGCRKSRCCEFRAALDVHLLEHFANGDPLTLWCLIKWKVAWHKNTEVVNHYCFIWKLCCQCQNKINVFTWGDDHTYLQQWHPAAHQLELFVILIYSPVLAEQLSDSSRYPWTRLIHLQVEYDRLVQVNFLEGNTQVRVANQCLWCLI